MRVAFLTLLLIFQDVDKARQLMLQAVDALKPAPVNVVISTPAEFDAAVLKAAPGAVLTLSRTLTYPNALAVTKSLTIVSDGPLPVARMDAATPLPSFKDGIVISADNVTLVGVEVKKVDPLTDILVFTGANVSLDRVRILGDPVKGAKRGVRANGNGSASIVRSYIDDCFQAYPGNDSQAILAWDMAPGLLIEDDFLRGGSETVMIGGADSSTPERMPSQVTIRGNTITKRPEWQKMAVGVKNTLELKAVKNALIEDNVIEYSWGGHGQDGYLFLITVRNQDGRAPWSTVQNVVFRNNRLSHGAAAFNILGLDNIRETKSNMPTPVGAVRPSVKASTLSLTGNMVTDVDPTAYAGSNRLILIGGSPADVTIDMNAFTGQHLGSQVYFYGSLPGAILQGLMITNNTWPPATYGVKGDGTASGTATWNAYVGSGSFSGNVVQP